MGKPNAGTVHKSTKAWFKDAPPTNFAFHTDEDITVEEFLAVFPLHTENHDQVFRLLTNNITHTKMAELINEYRIPNRTGEKVSPDVKIASAMAALRKYPSISHGAGLNLVRVFQYVRLHPLDAAGQHWLLYRDHKTILSLIGGPMAPQPKNVDHTIESRRQSSADEALTYSHPTVLAAPSPAVAHAQGRLPAHNSPGQTLVAQSVPVQTVNGQGHAAPAPALAAPAPAVQAPAMQAIQVVSDHSLTIPIMQHAPTQSFLYHLQNHQEALGQPTPTQDAKFDAGLSEFQAHWSTNFTDDQLRAVAENISFDAGLHEFHVNPDAEFAEHQREIVEEDKMVWLDPKLSTMTAIHTGRSNATIYHDHRGGSLKTLKSKPVSNMSRIQDSRICKRSQQKDRVTAQKKISSFGYRISKLNDDVSLEPIQSDYVESEYDYEDVHGFSSAPELVPGWTGQDNIRHHLGELRPEHQKDMLQYYADYEQQASGFEVASNTSGQVFEQGIILASFMDHGHYGE